MDLFDLLKVLLRRWAIVVPMLGLTLGLTYVVHVQFPPLYSAEGFLVIETPAFEAAQDPTADIDPVQLVETIRDEQGFRDRNIAASVLGGGNYAVSASADREGQSIEDVQALIDRLRTLMGDQQDDLDVADRERAVLRLVTPRIVTEEQADGNFLASATVYVDDPALTAVNPYGLDATTRRLLQVSIMGDAGQARFESATGPDVEVEVIQDDRDAAPLLRVITSGPVPADVLDAFDVARDLIAEDLATRQDRANVISAQRLTLAPIDAPTEAEIAGPPINRVTAAVLALGGMLALGTALGVEFLSRWRARTALVDDGDDGHDGHDGADGEDRVDGQVPADLARPSPADDPDRVPVPAGTTPASARPPADPSPPATGAVPPAPRPVADHRADLPTPTRSDAGASGDGASGDGATGDGASGDGGHHSLEDRLRSSMARHGDRPGGGGADQPAGAGEPGPLAADGARSAVDPEDAADTDGRGRPLQDTSRARPPT